MEKDYRKSIVPKDDYMATIVFSHYDGNKFYLWWTIDTGKHTGHKISSEFPCTDFGQQLLERMCKRIRTTCRGKVTDMSSIFPLQFRGKRSKISVDIQHERSFIRNIITHHQLALAPPEENVLTGRTTSHFYKEQTGRKLPI